LIESKSKAKKLIEKTHFIILQQLIKKFDRIAGIETNVKLLLWLERSTFLFLLLMAISAPHSIAATQISWLTGMLLWTIAFFVRIASDKSENQGTFGKRLFSSFSATIKNFSKLDLLFFALYFWTVISSYASYAPDISTGKLRSAGLFVIIFFVYNNLRTLKTGKVLVFVLIASCMVSVLWTPMERIWGRGVEIHGVSKDGILGKATFIDGDTLLKANGKKLNNPDDLIREIEQNESTKVDIYREDYYAVITIGKMSLSSGAATERLGIESWQHNRRWRSAGFYGHYTTFAEVLQLIVSLTFGLFIGLFSKKLTKGTFLHENQKLKIVLFCCLAMMSLALLMTVTRASQLAFLISAFAILIVSGNRKLLLIFAAIVVPVAIIGLIYLQQTRKVGFFDQKDNSITWRQTVYREGFNLATDSPRHLLVGVGMDSIKRFAPEWHLFDDGKLPMGHFHSTPLQLAVERGMPALLLWLLILATYGKTLYSAIRREESTLEKGILLGCFGGLIGFFTSGLVHYNLGDGEVAMVFYLLVGTSLAIANLSQSDSDRVLDINLSA
jgi:O-Antigen ligase